MSLVAHLGRKADQQLAYCEQLLALASDKSFDKFPASDRQVVSSAAVDDSSMDKPPINNKLRAPLVNALTWQLEQAICWYLLELVRVAGNKHWRHQWTLDIGVLVAAADAVHSADAREFVDLAQQLDSWLASFLSGLSTMRSLEAAAAIQGEIFQSDLASPQSADIIASSGPTSAQADDLQNIRASVSEFRALITRQRAGHIEY